MGPLGPGGGAIPVNPFYFYVNNTSDARIGVTVEYKAAHNNAWTTRTHFVEPRTKQYLLETYNRFVYVTAGSLTQGRNYRWERHQVDLGAVPNHATHTLTAAPAPAVNNRPQAQPAAKTMNYTIKNDSGKAVSIKLTVTDCGARDFHSGNHPGKRKPRGFGASRPGSGAG